MRLEATYRTFPSLTERRPMGHKGNIFQYRFHQCYWPIIVLTSSTLDYFLLRDLFSSIPDLEVVKPIEALKTRRLQ